MNKHIRLRIESWCKKFCLITNNIEWKKNRNLHAISLLNMIINGHLEEPYTKFAPEGPLPFLSKPLVKSKLSNKFLIYSSNAFKFPLPEKSHRAFSSDKINDNKSYNMKIKRPKTPGETNLKYNYLNNNHFNEINKCNDPDLLKNFIAKLQKQIDETNIIIKKQNEEKNIMLKKIAQLENLIKSCGV